MNPKVLLEIYYDTQATMGMAILYGLIALGALSYGLFVIYDRLYKGKPYLTLDAHGITILPNKQILWATIKNIPLEKFGKNTYVCVYFADGDKHIVSHSGDLVIDQHALKKELEERLEAYKQGKKLDPKTIPYHDSKAFLLSALALFVSLLSGVMGYSEIRKTYDQHPYLTISTAGITIQQQPLITWDAIENIEIKNYRSGRSSYSAVTVTQKDNTHIKLDNELQYSLNEINELLNQYLQKYSQ